MDVEQILATGDERDLWGLWDIPTQRRMWERALEVAREDGNDEHMNAAQGALDELPEVTSLQALRANARLVDLLTGRRWYVIEQAREDGASWEQIGEALRMSRQAAWTWYRRKIADQERYVGDLHDTARARAALGDPEN